MRQGGFSYVVVMFLVAILSIVSVRALESTLVAERRDKETELLWRGQAYLNAIREYYLKPPGDANSYPAQLKDLLADTRFANQPHRLRKLYRDPMTNDEQWGLVHDENGHLIGVYSLSQLKPLKQAGFPLSLKGFTNAQHYSDWKFVYKP